MKKVLSTIVSVLLVITTLLCGTVMVKTAMGKEPSVFGIRFFYVVTGSMEPTIPVGAAVVVHKQDGNSYRVGDIITFVSSQAEISGHPNTHRIIAAEQDGNHVIYRTKGDANSIPDAEPVLPESIYGRVIWHSGSMTWLGTLLGMITTPLGFFSVIVLPILAIAGLAVRDFAKDFEEEVRKAAREGQEETKTPEAKEETKAQEVQEEVKTPEAQETMKAPEPGKEE